jgi:hypothetical protein
VVNTRAPRRLISSDRLQNLELVESGSLPTSYHSLALPLQKWIKHTPSYHKVRSPYLRGLLLTSKSGTLDGAVHKSGRSDLLSRTTERKAEARVVRAKLPTLVGRGILRRIGEKWKIWKIQMWRRSLWIFDAGEDLVDQKEKRGGKFGTWWRMETGAV